MLKSISILLLISTLTIYGFDQVDYGHKIARLTNDENSNEFLYAPYKVISEKRVLLVPTNCRRGHRSTELITLDKCGYRREKPFRMATISKQGDDLKISSLDIFTDSKEILDIENFEILGIKIDEADVASAFYKFTKEHAKVYSNAEEHSERFKIFRKNAKHVKLLGHLDTSAVYGLTKFSDLTTSEFKRKHLGYRHQEMNEAKTVAPNMRDKDLPEQFDWRQHGAVTEVKDQKSCGSCWAFSVVGNIEGRYYLAKNKLISLSEQELVDCDDIDHGCDGGFPLNAFMRIMQLGGLETEQDYPYVGYQEDKCKFVKKSAKVNIRDSYQVSKNETDIAKELYLNGPVSMALDAFWLQFYWSGVSHPPSFLCGSLDHAVLGVGYGFRRTYFLKRYQPFWIIKNSWGESWGEDGYFRIYRGDGTCGINQMVTSGIIN